ncbi:fucolectin-5-like [Ascaphus truei]|uniref:fucolectin-5-like n=1 Tax=Ascaphus truei TaxID=8439 RepID=UPI003F5A2598
MKFFVLLFVYAVLGWAQSCCQPPGGPNLARPVEANQSSTYIYALSPEVGGATVEGTADRAIDGNKESNAYLHPCSHTKYEQDPWWRLDMKQSNKIDTIVITNRQDCCSERLKGAEVRVGNSADNNNPICGTINDISKPIITLCCNGMVGRYVSVVIPGRVEYLTLCEVEVYTG